MSARADDRGRSLSALLALCTGCGRAVEPAGEAGWRALMATAGDHGVRPLLWLAVSGSDLPQPIRSELRAVYAVTRMVNARLRREQREVEAAMRSEGVRVWSLKGVELSARLYDDIGARELSDIDLLVRPESLPDADRALRELGYAPWREYRTPRFGSNKEVLYVKRERRRAEVLVDLHQRLLSFRRRDPLAEAVFEDGWSPHVELTYLCVHQIAHRFGGLRHACDIQRWLERIEGVDWDALLDLAPRTGYAPGIWWSLRLQRELGSEAVPGKVLERLRPSRPRRALLRRLTGATPLEIIAGGPGRRGPAGALLTLACVRGLAGHAHHLRGWLFPSREDMHLAYGKQKHRSLARLYLDRLISKTSGLSPSPTDGAG